MFFGMYRHQLRASIPWFFGSMACRTNMCHPLARTCVATLLERCSAFHLRIHVSSPIAPAF